VTTKPTIHWVTCTRSLSHAVSRHAHAATLGALTTLCGASASTPDVWHVERRKPKCTECLDRLIALALEVHQ